MLTANRDLAGEYLNVDVYNPQSKTFYSEENNTISTLLWHSGTATVTEDTERRLMEVLRLELPEGSQINFHLASTPNIEFAVSKYYKRREDSIKNLSDEINEDTSVIGARKDNVDRINYMVKTARNDKYPYPEIQPCEASMACSITIPLKIKDPLGKGKSAYEREVRLLCEHRSTLVDKLKALEIEVEIADEAQYLGWVALFFNPYNLRDLGVDDFSLLRDQVFPVGASLSWRKGYPDLRVRSFDTDNENNKVHINVLSVHKYPSQESRYTFLSALNMLGDPKDHRFNSPFILTLSVVYPDQASARNMIMTKSAQTDKFSKNATLMRMSPLLRERRADFTSVIDEVNRGEMVVQVALTACFYGRSQKALRQTVDSAINYYRRTGLGFRFLREHWIADIIFRNILPINAFGGSWNNTKRLRTMTAYLGANLLPVFRDWRGQGNESLFLTRLGHPFGFSIFSKTNPNYQFLVLAESGSGKSFAVHRLVLDQLALGTRVFLIDSGNSYTAHADILGSNIISFHENSPVCLNPFTHLRPEDYQRQSEILLNIFVSMSLADATNKPTDRRLTVLRNAIDVAFKQKSNRATVDDVIESLEQISAESPLFEEAESSIYNLRQFSSQGVYGAWLCGTNTLRPDAMFTLLEMSDLINQPRLADVVIKLISMTISQEMFTKRDGIKRMLIVEEAGDRLKNENFADFLSGLCSKVRKEDGSVGIVLQNLRQVFYHPKIGQSIMASIPTKFVLRQEAQSIQDALDTKMLELTPYERRCISHLVTEKGKYSEIAVLSISGTEVVRLVETPYNRVLFNTESEVFKKMLAMAHRGEDVRPYVDQEARRLYADEY